jgi:hypothetical protein
MSRSKSLVETVTDVLEADSNPIEEVFLTEDGETFELLREGKWIKGGRFGTNIRIDQLIHLHGKGQPSAHIYGRNNKRQLVVVNSDGTGSHGTKGRLHPKDADALRARGFKIRPDNMVEWTLIDNAPQLLFG